MTTHIQISCAVSDLIESVRPKHKIQHPITDSAALEKMVKYTGKPGVFKVILNWRQNHTPEYETTITDETTVLSFLQEMAIKFEEAYGYVDPKTGTSVVLEGQMSACEMSMRYYFSEDMPAPNGVIISTPFVDGIQIDTNCISFLMGS